MYLVDTNMLYGSSAAIRITHGAPPDGKVVSTDEQTSGGT